MCSWTKRGENESFPRENYYQVNRVFLDGKIESIAKVYFLGTYTGSKYIKGTSQFCRYNPEDKNYWGNTKLENTKREHYIKPLSEKITVTQGE